MVWICYKKRLEWLGSLQSTRTKGRPKKTWMDCGKRQLDSTTKQESCHQQQ